MSALLDTSLVLDYLNGVPEAQPVCARYTHRVITVLTWVEIMAAAPAGLGPQTREFLRGFERLAIHEAIVDRALELIQEYTSLTLRHAIPWATAQANRLVYITVDVPPGELRDTTLLIPYRGRGS